MSTFAVVQGGLIVNRIVLDDASAWTAPEGASLVQESGEVLEIGGSYVDGKYTPPVIAIEKPSAIIAPISDRQFFEQLALQGIISQPDALAAVKTGTIPSVLQNLVNALPSDQQFGAQMLLSGATIFTRDHPLTNTIGAAYGMTAAQVDQFFLDAGKL